MEYVEFTKEMKDAGYRILIPNMLTVHFNLLVNIFEKYGYNMEILHNEGRAVVEAGLKYVHNDTCYPALIVIGQFINALQSGKYDLDRTALMMFQTGGGCRASNYICLIRKALARAGLGKIPVISLSFAGLEHHSGFKLTLPMLKEGMYALAYGDEMMLLSNQTRPYETHAGDTDALTAKLTRQLTKQGAPHSGGGMKRQMQRIAAEYAAIPRVHRRIVRTGIVGEIFVKYAAIANNNLERFLATQDCEVMVPGLLDFLLYSIQTGKDDRVLYGGTLRGELVRRAALGFLSSVKDKINAAAGAHGFVVPSSFSHLCSLPQDTISRGCKMGEGWLLTAEMLELYELGYGNIICAQPFGCLPNHVAGKGMIQTLRRRCPGANIVPIDYDPGASAVNQENRIKLMLAVAREKLDDTEKSEKITEKVH